MGSSPIAHPTRSEPSVSAAPAGDGDRRLVCTAGIPQGGLAWFVRGEGGWVLASTRFPCDQAIGRLGGKAPLGPVAFSCIGRRGILGDDVTEEEAQLIPESAGAPVAGPYTHGEIAGRRGVNAVHGQAPAILPLG